MLFRSNGMQSLRDCYAVWLEYTATIPKYKKMIYWKETMPMTKDKKVQWHPGFYGAMHLELRENKEDLEFTEEVILNTLPLRVDMHIYTRRMKYM